MKKLYLINITVFMASLIVLLPVCFADSISLTYDDNGNLVTGDGFYREYNSLNQLWKVYNGSDTSGNLLQEYVMHPTEERVLVKKVYYTNESLKETVYYVNDEFVRVINSSGTYDTTYVKHEGQRIGELKPDGTKQFNHPDMLGSSHLVTNELGEGISNFSQTPYGVILDSENVSRYSYTGQEYDDVIEDYDYHARRYKADLGKFTSPDPIIADPYNPQLLNSYAYTINNPYIYVDPDGKKIERCFSETRFFGKTGAHAYLRVTPDNPEDFPGKGEQWIIEGMPDWESGKLIIRNVAGDDLGRKIMGEPKTIFRPAGMSDTEHIKLLEKLVDEYMALPDDEKLDYKWSGGDGVTSGNSNVAARSLIKAIAAFLSISDYSADWWINAPGYNTISDKIGGKGGNVVVIGDEDSVTIICIGCYIIME